MRKALYLTIFVILFILASVFILNIEVTTRQGVDNTVSTLKIPLYLKILDFYDRHFNYKWLAYKITVGKTTEEDKVIAIFNWTIENIHHQPPELKTVDDHVWHIIVRGYGEHDQFSDVFTTLCNYAGIDAFFMRFFNENRTSQIPFAVVKMKEKWYLFDPYNGASFVTKNGSLASVEDIAKQDWSVKIAREDFNKTKVRYADYFSEILSIDFERSHKWSRANIQSPINRFFYGIFKRYLTNRN